MDDYFNKNRLWFKIVAVAVLCLFVLSDFSFALQDAAARKNAYTLSPASRIKPIVTIEEEDEGFAIVENKRERARLAKGFQEDAGFIYLNTLMAQVLARYGSRISADGLKDLIEKHLSHINFTRFKWRELYKEGDVFCLPYERKDDGHIQILRYYPPESKPVEFPHQVDLKFDDGSLAILEDPMREEREELPAHLARSRMTAEHVATQGIFSAKELVKRGLKVSASADMKDLSGDRRLSCNMITVEESENDKRHLDKSLYNQNQGSLQVVMERREDVKDWIVNLPQEKLQQILEDRASYNFMVIIDPEKVHPTNIRTIEGMSEAPQGCIEMRFSEAIAPEAFKAVMIPRQLVPVIRDAFPPHVKIIEVTDVRQKEMEITRMVPLIADGARVGESHKERMVNIKVPDYEKALGDYVNGMSKGDKLLTHVVRLTAPSDIEASARKKKKPTIPPTTGGIGNTLKGLIIGAGISSFFLPKTAHAAAAPVVQNAAPVLSSLLLSGIGIGILAAVILGVIIYKYKLRGKSKDMPDEEKPARAAGKSDMTIREAREKVENVVGAVRKAESAYIKTLRSKEEEVELNEKESAFRGACQNAESVRAFLSSIGMHGPFIIDDTVRRARENITRVKSDIRRVKNAAQEIINRLNTAKDAYMEALESAKSMKEDKVRKTKEAFDKICRIAEIAKDALAIKWTPVSAMIEDAIKNAMEEALAKEDPVREEEELPVTPQELRFCPYSELPENLKTGDLFELIRERSDEFGTPSLNSDAAFKMVLDIAWKRPVRGEKRDALLVFDKEDKPVAIYCFFLSGDPNRKIAWGDGIYVKKEMQGRGLGKISLEVLADYLKKKGMEEFEIGDIGSGFNGIRPDKAVQAISKAFMKKYPETIKYADIRSNGNVWAFSIDLTRFEAEHKYVKGYEEPEGPRGSGLGSKLLTILVPFLALFALGAKGHGDLTSDIIIVLFSALILAMPLIAYYAIRFIVGVAVIALKPAERSIASLLAGGALFGVGAHIAFSPLVPSATEYIVGPLLCSFGACLLVFGIYGFVKWLVLERSKEVEKNLKQHEEDMDGGDGVGLRSVAPFAILGEGSFNENIAGIFESLNLAEAEGYIFIAGMVAFLALIYSLFNGRARAGRLVKKFESDNLGIRSNALDQISKFGASAIEPLSKALRADSIIVNKLAVTAIGNIASNRPKLRSRLNTVFGERLRYMRLRTADQRLRWALEKAIRTIDSYGKKPRRTGRGDTPNLGSVNSYDLASHELLREHLKNAEQLQAWGQPVEGLDHSSYYKRRLLEAEIHLPEDLNVIIIQHDYGPKRSIEQKFLYLEPTAKKWIFAHSGTRQGIGKFVYLTEEAFYLLTHNTERFPDRKDFLEDLLLDEYEHATAKLEGRWQEDTHKHKDRTLRRYVEKNFKLHRLRMAEPVVETIRENWAITGALIELALDLDLEGKIPEELTADLRRQVREAKDLSVIADIQLENIRSQEYLREKMLQEVEMLAKYNLAEVRQLKKLISRLIKEAPDDVWGEKGAQAFIGWFEENLSFAELWSKIFDGDESILGEIELAKVVGEVTEALKSLRIFKNIDIDFKVNKPGAVLACDPYKMRWDLIGEIMRAYSTLPEEKGGITVSCDVADYWDRVEFIAEDTAEREEWIKSIYKECKRLEKPFYQEFRKEYPRDIGSCFAASYMLAHALSERLNIPINNFSLDRIEVEVGKKPKGGMTPDLDATHAWIVVFRNGVRTLQIDPTRGQYHPALYYNKIYIEEYWKALESLNLKNSEEVFGRVHRITDVLTESDRRELEDMAKRVLGNTSLTALRKTNKALVINLKELIEAEARGICAEIELDPESIDFELQIAKETKVAVLLSEWKALEVFREDVETSWRNDFSDAFGEIFINALEGRTGETHDQGRQKIPRVIVKAWDEGDDVIVEVWDDGEGLTEEVIESFDSLAKKGSLSNKSPTKSRPGGDPGGDGLREYFKAVGRLGGRSKIRTTRIDESSGQKQLIHTTISGKGDIIETETENVEGMDPGRLGTGTSVRIFLPRYRGQTEGSTQPAGSIPSVFKYLCDSGITSQEKALYGGLIADNLNRVFGTIKYDLRALYYHLHLIEKVDAKDTGRNAKYYVPEGVRNKAGKILPVLARFVKKDLIPKVALLKEVYEKEIVPILEQSIANEELGIPHIPVGELGLESVDAVIADFDGVDRDHSEENVSEEIIEAKQALSKRGVHNITVTGLEQGRLFAYFDGTEKAGRISARNDYIALTCSGAVASLVTKDGRIEPLPGFKGVSLGDGRTKEDLARIARKALLIACREADIPQEAADNIEEWIKEEQVTLVTRMDARVNPLRHRIAELIREELKKQKFGENIEVSASTTAVDITATSKGKAAIQMIKLLKLKKVMLMGDSVGTKENPGNDRSLFTLTQEDLQKAGIDWDVELISVYVGCEESYELPDNVIIAPQGERQSDLALTLYKAIAKAKDSRSEKHEGPVYKNIDVRRWMEYEDIIKVSRKYGDSDGITPAIISQGVSWIDILAAKLPGLSSEQVSFGSTLKGAEILVVGPGKNGEEVFRFLECFPLVKAIHVVSADKVVFDNIDKGIETMLDQGAQPRAKIYGYKVNAMELPDELEGRIDLTFHAYVFTDSDDGISSGQKKQAAREITRSLKIGGAAVYPPWYKKMGAAEGMYASEDKMTAVPDLFEPLKVRIKSETRERDRIAQDFVEAVRARDFKASKASKQDQNIIIGIDTSWIPDMQGIQLLLNYISRIAREKGLGNVIVVRGRGEALAGNILKEAKRTNTPLSNVIALGEESAIKANAFNKLRSTETDKKAFLVGVDPKNLTDNSYISLLEMLTFAMKLAFNEINEVDAPGLTATQIGPRTWIFIPEACPMDFEEKKAVYEAQVQALIAA